MGNIPGCLILYQKIVKRGFGTLCRNIEPYNKYSLGYPVENIGHDGNNDEIGREVDIHRPGFTKAGAFCYAVCPIEDFQCLVAVFSVIVFGNVFIVDEKSTTGRD